MRFVNMRGTLQKLFIMLLVLFDVGAFTISQRRSIVQLNSAILSSSLAASPKKDDEGTKEDMNPLTRATWYAVESFGNIFGKKEGDGKAEGNEKGTVEVDLTKAPSSMDEAVLRIQMDNDRYYFLSGKVDKLAYTEQCTFSDPFVSFDGRDRFVDNLQNLGSFITNYNAKMLNYDVIQNDSDSSITQVKTKVRSEHGKKICTIHSMQTLQIKKKSRFVFLVNHDFFFWHKGNGQVGIKFTLETNSGMAMGSYI